MYHTAACSLQQLAAEQLLSGQAVLHVFAASITNTRSCTLPLSSFAKLVKTSIRADPLAFGFSLGEEGRSAEGCEGLWPQMGKLTPKVCELVAR
jgi:hypothetical protein